MRAGLWGFGVSAVSIIDAEVRELVHVGVGSIRSSTLVRYVGSLTMSSLSTRTGASAAGCPPSEMPSKPLVTCSTPSPASVRCSATSTIPPSKRS